MQSFTTYVTITDGKDPNASESIEAPAPEIKPTSAPVILMSGYEIQGDSVTAGDPVTATVTLKNTSTGKGVQNMVLTVTEPSADFTLKNDSSTIFLGKLGAGKEMKVTLEFDTAKAAPEGKYVVSFGMTYDDPEANTYSSTGSFSVMVRQQLDVRLTMPRIEEVVQAGDTIPLTFQVMNLGRSAVTNVRCEVSGNGLKGLSTAFVGDMEAGSEAEASMNLFVQTLDMSEGAGGNAKYGETAGEVLLIYEDSAGNEYREEYPFTTTITAPQVTSSVKTEPEETSGSWAITVTILGGLLALVVTGVVAYRLGTRRVGNRADS